jgi:hypothetical protein
MPVMAGLKGLNNHQNNNCHKKNDWHLIENPEVNVGFVAGISRQSLHMA